ncbi:MAG: ribosomal L7Ae/L30e/S12e/Gadd45 family protein [Clostridia bacterium]|nr:ribosomal L7Ae/L30e/S12e/Gadd45 family protein [Clostridia bacterium]
MDKVLGMIGLAKRAGAVSAGGFLCTDAIKKRTARLVIIAADASEKSKKSIIDSCIFYKIPFLEFSVKDELGRYSGGGEKSVISINDRNFAEAIIKKIGTAQRKDR